MIAKILRKMDFNVVVTNDVINVLITDFKIPILKIGFEIMGKLTAYTKQLDITLYNDAIADIFYKVVYKRTHETVYVSLKATIEDRLLPQLYCVLSLWQ